MLNVSHDLCGAHTECWYVGPSLVSSFLYNHSLVLSRRLKQSRLAALLHLALSTVYSTGMVSFTHNGFGFSDNTLSSILCKLLLLLRYLYAIWCLLVLHIKSLNAAEPLVSSRSSSCCNSILFLIKHACSHMLCSMSTVLTLLKLLHGWLKVSFTLYLLWSVQESEDPIWYPWPSSESSLFRQLLLQLCPSLLLSRTQLRVPLLPGAKFLQLTGADGSTHSATGFSIYDGVCWFVYHWFLAVGHGYQIGLVDISTFMVSCIPLISCGITLVLPVLPVYVPTEVRPVTVGPLKGALCSSTLYPTALFLAVLHTWTLPRLLVVLHTWVVCLFSVSVSCLCSEYVPTEVRPVTVGPLKGALCLSTLIPRHCCWLYCTPGLCPDFWLYCTPGSSVSSLSSLSLM
ncbi:hypothetical protein MP228_001769 [Amoeboaphelidium protococcarum]|nr:hypothetical protein MP228_001769 [Amoeboaphelidium protococcarum]